MKKRDSDSEFLAAKKHVIDVAKELHEKGYLPRTWGNVSCKVNKDMFLITPSGIRYEDLTPDMISLVNFRNLSFKGDYIPSYERGIHAACYRTRKDVEFVVLTHQVFASCAGVLGLKRIYTYYEDEDVVIPCVPYGFPGSTKLAGNVVATLKKNRDSDSFILSNHGALFVGANSDEVIENIERIEDACDNFLMDVCKTDMYHGVEEGFGSHLEGDEIIYDIEDTPERVKHIHREIYERRPDVKYIVHNKSVAVMTVSRTATHLRPLLFDFAELVGYSVKIPSNEHGKDGHSYHNIKKNSNAVFALNDGAYCIGETLEDAVAASIVLDKGCIAYLAALRHGEGHPISYLDCIKMNKYYKKTYSQISNMHSEEEIEDDEPEVSRRNSTNKPIRKTEKGIRKGSDDTEGKNLRKYSKKKFRDDRPDEPEDDFLFDHEDEYHDDEINDYHDEFEDDFHDEHEDYPDGFEEDYPDEFEDDYHDEHEDYHDEFEDDYPDEIEDDFRIAHRKRSKDNSREVSKRSVRKRSENVSRRKKRDDLIEEFEYDTDDDDFGEDFRFETEDDFADDLRDDFKDEFEEEFGEDFRFETEDDFSDDSEDFYPDEERDYLPKKTRGNTRKSSNNHRRTDLNDHIRTNSRRRTR